MNDKTQVAAPAILYDKLVAIIEDFLIDFDEEYQEDLTPETKLLADLGFESIDVIQLVVAIEEELKTRNVQFEELLMVDGRYVDDLSIGQIAEFLATKL